MRTPVIRNFVSGPDGAGFTIENPNEPPRVRQISATELKAMMDGRLSFELVDVRTEEERAITKIEGSRLLNEEGHDYLLIQPAGRNRRLVPARGSVRAPLLRSAQHGRWHGCCSIESATFSQRSCFRQSVAGR